MRMVEVEHVSSTADGFGVRAAGTASEAGVLLLCCGMRYEPPALEGLAELSPHGAYHCPYCDGWGLRGRPLAVYGANAAHLALMLSSRSDDILLLTDGSSELDPVEATLMRSAGVQIRNDVVARVEALSYTLARVVFADGSTDDRAGLFVVPTAQRSRRSPTTR